MCDIDLKGKLGMVSEIAKYGVKIKQITSICLEVSARWFKDRIAFDLWMIGIVDFISDLGERCAIADLPAVCVNACHRELVACGIIGFKVFYKATEIVNGIRTRNDLRQAENDFTLRELRWDQFDSQSSVRYLSKVYRIMVDIIKCKCAIKTKKTR